MTESSWVFVTDRNDGHADRFHRLFDEIHPGCERLDVVIDSKGVPQAIREGVSLNSWSEIQEWLAGSALVISGPLDSVSRHIAGGSSPHVGISWATDLMVSAASSHQAATDLETAVASMDLVITDNYATENALVSMGVAAEKIVRIPWGPQPAAASLPGTQDAGVKEKWGIPDDLRVVLYPRALEEHYDPLVFVDAFAQLVRDQSNVCAVLVESGLLVPAVKEALIRAGIEDQAFWVPPLDSAEFHALICASALVVVSPKTDGTSVTVMEAMSLGTPVVTSLTSGSAEWVMEGITGWSFPVGNPEALYSAMSRRFDASEAEISSITDRAKTLVASRAGWGRSAAMVSKALQAL